MQKRAQVGLLLSLAALLSSTVAWTTAAAETMTQQEDPAKRATGGPFSLQGAIARTTAYASGDQVAGDSLTLRGTVLNAVAEDAVRPNRLGLVASPQQAVGAGSDCLCTLLFEDGFETGDTSQWSSVSP